MNTIRRIEAVAAKRQANWANGNDTQVTYDCTQELDGLWAKHRLERARRRYGDHETIVKTARVERELERLMKTNHKAHGG